MCYHGKEEVKHAVNHCHAGSDSWLCRNGKAILFVKDGQGEALIGYPCDPKDAGDVTYIGGCLKEWHPMVEISERTVSLSHVNLIRELNGLAPLQLADILPRKKEEPRAA